MADFVAVLSKTISALGENTPEMRERVYDKARSPIEAKLAAITPPPPALVVERQMKALEDAIAVVKADYEAPVPDQGDELDEVLDSLNMLGTDRPAPAITPVFTPPPAAAMPKAPPPPETVAPAAPAPAPATAPAVSAQEPQPEPRDPVVEERGDAVAEAETRPDAIEPVDVRPVAADKKAIAAAAARRKKPSGGLRQNGGMIAAAAILLVVVSAGGYGIWSNRDAFAGLFGGTNAPSGQPPATSGEVAVTEPQEPDAGEAEEEVAALAPESGGETQRPAPPAAQETERTVPTPEGPEKFTQRLLPDGREVDEGPAGGPRTIGEGTSVASAVAPTVTDAPAEAAETTPEASSEQASATPSLAVGQRAIFYEERTSQADASAESGSIVWSVVRESPGGDLPPEPAIRAEATIPGKDLQLRMTIRRNGDQTLPAAHIVEMIFLTPDGFEGGSISNVSRISFKQTEQDTGNPLIGIPAKIADGFFLIALSDAPSEIEANTSLLRIQRWLDIPIVYDSGRRALLSVEKGIPGERVFEEVLRAWADAAPIEQAG